MTGFVRLFDDKLEVEGLRFRLLLPLAFELLSMVGMPYAFALKSSWTFGIFGL